jgi:hypothetical protein
LTARPAPIPAPAKAESGRAAPRRAAPHLPRLPWAPARPRGLTPDRAPEAAPAPEAARETPETDGTRQLKGAEADAGAAAAPPKPPRPPNRTGLPDALKAGVEALSGLAMDDVRVHRNSAEPAKLGALAYAKGDDIHLGSGQEQHLPHEAWHVVQQKQGRVRPTIQLREASISDDTALEAEAEAMGARAAVLPDRQADGGALQRVRVDGPAAVVQRAVGFEWEVDAITLHEVTEARDAEKPAELPSKAVAFRRGGVRLEVDSGHGEFVTEPAETMNQVEAQLEVIGQVIDDLQAAEQRTLYMTAPDVIVFTDDSTGQLGQAWMNKGDWIQVRLTGPATGTFQATSGVKFSASALLTELRASVEHHEKSEKQLWLKDFDTAEKAAGKAAGSGTRTLIVAVEYFIAACRGGDPSAEDGPKTWMPLLLRTDFRSMYRALTLADKQEFRKWAVGRADGSRLCPGGYKGADGNKHAGPTLHEWLASIVASAAQGSGNREADKDLMSPPPGFKRHLTRQAKQQDASEGKPVADPIPYAMGLYELDKGEIIAERRSMTRQGGLNSGRVNFGEMAKLAMEFAESHGLAKFNVPPAQPLPEQYDDDVEYFDDEERYAADDEYEEASDEDESPVTEFAEMRDERNWYKKLCEAAKDALPKYRKGMFDYSKLGNEDDDVGATRLTPEHYDLFDQIRASRPDLPLNPTLLEYVFETWADPEERVFNYADIEDSR